MNVNRAQGDYFGAGVLRSMCLSMLIGFLFSTAGRAQTGGPPGIACPGDVTVECVAAVDDGLSGTDCVVAFGSIGTNTDPSNTGSATAIDNCTGDPDPAITFADVVAGGACPQEMVITRTWTATDDCGSNSCDQTILSVTGANDQFAGGDGDGFAESTRQKIVLDATTVPEQYAGGDGDGFDLSPESTITLNYSGTIDTEPPTIICPGDINQNTDPGLCDATVAFPDPTVTDNSPGATFSCNPTSGSMFAVGVQ